jgi:hypothetical protein
MDTTYTFKIYMALLVCVERDVAEREEVLL